MQSANNDLLHRSYSQVSMSSQNDARAPIYDDMTIAEGLLNKRSSSFTGTRPLMRADGKFGSTGALTAASSGITRRGAMHTSNTWTSSSGDVASDRDEVDDRTVFVQEFNRLARKHGIRPMVYDEGDEAGNNDPMHMAVHKDNWFSRKILRRTSSTLSQGMNGKPEGPLKHRRSISDSLRMKAKRDKLKDKDLQELVRLCGSTLLYLPTEYAAGSLAVPTCFRATAQYLIQHGTATRGVFRIPGSHAVVTALYNHYCSTDHDGEAIAGTVRCPTLPEHLRCDVHDVASAFKRFLSGLPGGILGSLPLFESLISIQSQLLGDPEFTKTKQTKVRARLIALAIATLRSQYRRELICAVFGLLCMVGRAAETSRREDDRGRPLPTSDLMGYGPLGVVFGPLLVGDLLEDFTMRIANPHGGLILLPISPPKTKKERKKKTTRSGDEGNPFNTYVDKVKVANSVTEMIITHWRDVVRHMKNLSALKVVGGYQTLGAKAGVKSPFLRPSASESFAIRKPPDWDDPNPIRRVERSPSPTPVRRVSSPVANADGDFPHNDSLKVRKQRSRSKPYSTQRLSVTKSMSILSPTAEEHSRDDESPTLFERPHSKEKSNASSSSNKENRPPPDVSKLPPAPPSRPSSASREKTTLHSQPLDQLKFMEPNLSLIKGIPSAAPKSTRSPNKAVSVGYIDNRRAPERVPHYSEPSFGTSTKITASQPAHTLMKPLSPSPPPQIGLLKLGPVAWAKKSLSRNSNQLQENSTPSSNKKKPRVLVFRASTRDSDEQTPKDNRRLGGSEPSIPARYAVVPNRSPRKVSRSMYDDPQQREKLFELDHVKRFPQKDPLSSVSQEEDLASLAKLAQALDFLEDQDEATSAPKTDVVAQEPPRSPNPVGKSTSTRSHESSTLPKPSYDSRAPRPKEIASLSRPTSQQKREIELRCETTILDNSYHEVRATQHGIKIRDFAIAGEQTADEKNCSPLQSDQNIKAVFSENRDPRPASPHRILPTQAPVTPKSQTSLHRNTLSGTPRSNKFSVLVAKFNNPEFQSSSDTSPSRIPQRSVNSFSGEEARKRVDSPKSLVAPYTTNTPSPAKSQKSTISVITPHSRRSSTIINRKQDVSGAPDPTRVSPGLRDTTPCRRPQGFSQIPSPRSSPPASTRPSSVGCKQAPCPLEDIMEAQRESSSSNEDLECPFVTQTTNTEAAEECSDGICSTPGCSTTVEEDRIYEHIVAPAMKMPVLRQSPISLAVKAIPSAAFLTTIEVTTGTDRECEVSPPCAACSPTPISTDVVTFDGPNGSLNLRRLPIAFGSTEDKLPRPKSSPSLPVDASSFVHPDSPFMGAFTERSTGSTSPGMHKRSDSVPYSQIRTLQKQISSKNEEIRQLKKQIDARRSLEIGTLSEQLREAKQEIQMWKSRAEVAEKQVEIFSKISSRNNSPAGLSTQSPRRMLARSSTANAAYPGEAADMATRIRKALHGMDGNESPPRWSSEESSDTVVHESFLGLEIIGNEGGLPAESPKKNHRYEEKHLLD